MHPDQRSNPPFPTPQPDELQSEESKAGVRERLAEQQGAETKIPEERARQQNGSAGAAVKLEDIENLADRHLPNLDSPPG